jgi:uncharacterized protein YndB with AHSA1/START domain
LKKRSIITDKLVIEKTGKPLEDWFSLLDSKGAKNMNQKEIFSLVNKTRGLAPLGEWNQNLLTTTYTWSRGIKERGQKENGFEISVSKTIQVPAAVLFDCWINDEKRKTWLKNKILIRKSTPDKSARITWPDNGTSLSVEIYPKGENKSQVVVQHLKLSDSEKANEMKEFWMDTLGKLKTLLETTR